jgi:hypothetical protein
MPILAPGPRFKGDMKNGKMHMVTRIVLKGGGNDREWMGLTECSLWFALPISLPE